MPQYGPFRNTILQRLDPDVLRRLDLKPHRLKVSSEIEFPGKPIRNLIFLETGIASMTVAFEDASEVEVGLYGHEGVLGASALVGTLHSLNHVYMQSDGTGYRCTLADAMREFERFNAFHNLVLRFQQAQFIQTAQTAACNARHTVRQRLARWLLLSHERLGTGVMNLTQEFLGHMLGVRRTSVQSELDAFKKKGLVQVSRGKITILDQYEMGKIACECYRTVVNHLSSYIDVEQGAK